MNMNSIKFDLIQKLKNDHWMVTDKVFSHHKVCQYIAKYVGGSLASIFLPVRDAIANTATD